MSSTDAATLKSFLNTLPRTDRHILLLSLADGLNTTEIGLVLDLTEARVAARLERLKAGASGAIRAARKEAANHLAVA